MTVRLRGGDPTARSALEESILDEERLVDFLERARIFADVFQILTPEQQAKAKELSGSRAPRPHAQR